MLSFITKKYADHDIEKNQAIDIAKNIVKLKGLTCLGLTLPMHYRRELEEILQSEFRGSLRVLIIWQLSRGPRHFQDGFQTTCEKILQLYRTEQRMMSRITLLHRQRYLQDSLCRASRDFLMEILLPFATGD